MKRIIAFLFVILLLMMSIVVAFAEDDPLEDLKTFTCENCGKEFQISEAEQQLGTINDLDNTTMCPVCLGKINKGKLTQAQTAALTVMMQMVDLRDLCLRLNTVKSPSGQDTSKSQETENPQSINETENTTNDEEVADVTVPINGGGDNEYKERYPLAASTVNNVSTSTFVIVIIGTLIIGLGVGFIVSMIIFKKKKKEQSHN